MNVAEDVLDSIIADTCPKDADPDDWDLDALKQQVSQTFGLEPDVLDETITDELGQQELRDTLWETVEARYDDKVNTVGREVFTLPDDVRAQIIGSEQLPVVMNEPDASRAQLAGQAVIAPIERNIMLQIVDVQWKDHLYSLDHLKEGIGLRGYGQRDPLVEYKKESFGALPGHERSVEEERVRYLWRLRPVIDDGSPEPPRRPARQRAPLPRSESKPEGGRPSPASFAGAARRRRRRPGRRAPAATMRR